MRIQTVANYFYGKHPYLFGIILLKTVTDVQQALTGLILSNRMNNASEPLVNMILRCCNTKLYFKETMDGCKLLTPCKLQIKSDQTDATFYFLLRPRSTGKQRNRQNKPNLGGYLFGETPVENCENIF